MLDTVNIFINNDASIYVIQNSSTIKDSNIITWHARLGHIGQDRLHRLALACQKRNFPSVSIVLLEKQLDYHLTKLKELVVHYNLFIQIFMAQ